MRTPATAAILMMPVVLPTWGVRLNRPIKALPACGRAWILPGSWKNSKPGNCSKMPQNPTRQVYAVSGAHSIYQCILFKICFTARSIPFSARMDSPTDKARCCTLVFATAYFIASANLSAVSFACGIGDGATPKSAVRCPQKYWSPTNGQIICGLPARNAAPVVPAPP